MAEFQKPFRLASPTDLMVLKADEAIPLVRSSVVALYRSDQFEQPDFEGSGVLLNLAGRYFLVSAAHVFDALAGDVFLLLEDQDNVRLSAQARCTKAPGGIRDSDRIDIGYIPLTEAEAEALGTDSFLKAHHLSPRDAAAPRRGYFALGFPASKQERDDMQNIYKTMLMRVTTAEVRTPLYQMTKFQRDFHLLLRFNERHMWGINGKRGAIPNPKGLSGGGVWRLNPLEQYREDNKPRLVAITIERPPEYRKGLLATRIELVLASIREEFPDIVRDIAPSPLVQVNVTSP